ncbi:hypothetical protein AAHC03_04514 [Spirometra sp. Aus1]
MGFARLSRKKLQMELQDLSSFSEPKQHLEQYPTSPHVAADVLFDIQTRDGAIEDKVVADLGCGAGMLTIGAHLLGARLVVGFDIDADAVKDLTQNIGENIGPDRRTIEVVLCDITKLAAREKIFDTVIMNPPFGTTDQTNGMDIAFLKKALSLSRENVYSLHKTTTRKHIIKTVEGLGARCEVVAELRFDIPKIYKKHRYQSVDVAVDLVHSWFES